jgi:hypothetical protein
MHCVLDESHIKKMQAQVACDTINRGLGDNEPVGRVQDRILPIDFPDR